MISDDVKDKIMKLATVDRVPLSKIGKMVGVSTPSVYLILNEKGYKNTCEICGTEISGNRNKRYCDNCQDVANNRRVKKHMRRKLDMNRDMINMISSTDIRTRGDIFMKNKEQLGTLQLKDFYETWEEEWDAIVKEHERIFGIKC